MENYLINISNLANYFENKLKKYSGIDIDYLKPLEKFITSESNPKFFFTMTSVPKIGINFKSKFDTPLGVYAYPITKEYYNKLITNTLPFAGENPYINLFTLKVPTFNLSNYTDNDFKRDINTLKLMYNITDDIINEGIYSSYMFTSKESNIWNITRILAGNPKKWNTILRNLGYTHFYDPGHGTIHSNEPTQIVILDPSIIVPIESYHNPFVMDYKIRNQPIINKHLKPHIQELLLNKNNDKLLSELSNNKYLSNDTIIKLINKDNDMFTWNIINNYAHKLDANIIHIIAEKYINNDMVTSKLPFFC